MSLYISGISCHQESETTHLLIIKTNSGSFPFYLQSEPLLTNGLLKSIRYAIKRGERVLDMVEDESEHFSVQQEIRVLRTAHNFIARSK